MNSNKHHAEGGTSKSQDHEHALRPFWKHAHRDWRVWTVTVLMLVLILVYVMTDNLSLRPDAREVQPTPTAILP